MWFVLSASFLSVFCYWLVMKLFLNIREADLDEDL